MYVFFMLKQKLYQECLKKKCFYLDAPVIGSEETIKNKRASIVVGGHREVYKGMLPILFVLCNVSKNCYIYSLNNIVNNI